MVGVIPALRVRTANINVWLSLAYFGPNAGALVPGAATPAGSATTQALVAAAVADARECGCDSMTVYTPLNASDDAYRAYRAGLGGADFELERVSQTRAIVPTEGTAGESPWPRKVRYDVRRSESLGVSVRPVASDAELDQVWGIYQRHCADVGIPVKPLAYVRHLSRTADRHGIFLLAEHGGEIVAGLICLMGGGVLSYYLPCTRTESRSLQPGLLLLDRAVAIARDAGCRLLNFEASPAVEGSVYKFKARCGGTPVTYRVFVKLLTPSALDTYRALGADALGAQVPQAFIVPFSALASPAPEAQS